MSPRLLLATCALLACSPRDLEGSGGGGAGTVQYVPTAPTARAPVFGGGVLTLSDGRFAAVADADRSVVWVVDLEQNALRGKISLPANSWPNRLTEDARGNLRVVLRRTGQLATLSLTTMSVKSIESVCAEPRGVAFSAHLQATLVACASGEFVTIPLTGSSSTRRLERDLRDVVVLGERVFVTTFREGRVLEVTGAPRHFAQVSTSGPFVGGVAWRAIASGDRLIISHQRALTGEVLGMTNNSNAIPTGAYGAAPSGPGGCPTTPIVQSAVTILSLQGDQSSREVGGALPVDVAALDAQGNLAVAVAGSGGVERSFTCPRPAPVGDEVIGVAATRDGRLIEATRDTVRVQGQAPILFGEPLATDEGHALFHAVSPTGVACASCHPEAGDDARVWTIGGKAHRTQALTGGLLDTAPFHWEGQLQSLSAVMDDTFVVRMGGQRPAPAVVKQLGDWLQRLPSPRAAPADATLVAQGKRLFSQAHCDGCHSGARFTNASTVDVGTGGAFQVPSLRGVAARAPLMHSGCAANVRERFTTSCGGAAHGDLSQLTPQDLDALSAYVESL